MNVDNFPLKHKMKGIFTCARCVFLEASSLLNEIFPFLQRDNCITEVNLGNFQVKSCQIHVNSKVKVQQEKSARLLLKVLSNRKFNHHSTVYTQYTGAKFHNLSKRKKFSQNLHFQSLIFSQNSHFQSRIFHTIHIFQPSNSW